jgi:hypothetical protein
MVCIVFWQAGMLKNGVSVFRKTGRSKMGLHLDLCVFWSDFDYLSNSDADIFFAFVNDLFWVVFWREDCRCGFPD